MNANNSNNIVNAIKNLTAVVLGIVIIRELWTVLEVKKQNKSADLQRIADSIGSDYKEYEYKKALENLANRAD